MIYYYYYYFDFIRTFFIFFATFHGRVTRVGVITYSSVVSYPKDELVWAGDRAIFACSLIFLTEGTS